MPVTLIPTCAETLAKLHDAILELMTGKGVVGINYGDRSVQYSQRQLKDLQGLYGIYWRQCGEATGLPNLQANNMVERGPPVRVNRF